VTHSNNIVQSFVWTTHLSFLMYPRQFAAGMTYMSLLEAKNASHTLSLSVTL
jgi:hypothetical protein